MEGLEMYPEEFVKPLIVALGYLKNCNIRFNEKDFCRNTWRFLYLIPIYILYYISMSMYIVKLFTEGLDPFAKADMIPMWLLSTQVILKCIILLKNRKKVRAVIDHLGSNWRLTDLTEEQVSTKTSTMKRLNYGLNIFNKSALTVACHYLFLPIVETLIRIYYLGQDADLALPFACVYPFAVDNWPTYLACYAFQLFNVFEVVYIYLGTNLLLVILTADISIHFILLQEDLLNIKPTNNNKQANLDSDEEITEYHDWNGLSIGDFVKRHQEVISLTNMLNDVFNEIVFVSLLSATLIICFFAVAAKATTKTAYMVNNYAAIVIVMMTVFTLCYCSEMLSSSSKGIAHSAAKSLWYKGDLRYKTIICFIMMRSQNPCTLRSLNYSSISLKTFNKVLKTTYSYFSLASQMYDERG